MPRRQRWDEGCDCAVCEDMSTPDKKQQEIAWCWENQPDDYDWTAEYDRGAEEEAMWASHEAS